MKRNLWLRMLLASMGINLIGALLRFSGWRSVGTYVLWLGMMIFLVAIGGLVVKVFQRSRE